MYDWLFTYYVIQEMKLYELVAIIDPQLSQEDQQSVIAQIESWLPEGTTVEQKDEIGLQKVYQFSATASWVWYFVSWYARIPSSELVALKKKLTLMRGVLRHVIYSVDKHNPIVNFKEINATYTQKIEELNQTNKKSKLAA